MLARVWKSTKFLRPKHKNYCHGRAEAILQSKFNVRKSDKIAFYVIFFIF